MAMTAMLIAFQTGVYLQDFNFLAQEPFVSMPGNLFFKSVHHYSSSLTILVRETGVKDFPRVLSDADRGRSCNGRTCIAEGSSDNISGDNPLPGKTAWPGLSRYR